MTKNLTRKQAVTLLHTYTQYEACPYNTSVRTPHWLMVAKALHARGEHDLAAKADRRLMDGRDTTYTRVVKLADGTLALA